MRNTLTIFQKEIRSYFASPVAYLLLTVFAVLFGYFFWSSLKSLIIYGIAMQKQNRPFTMNINEQIIRPLLANIVPIVGLFLIPMISMRLFAEEKRTGTIELLATSPIRDVEVIIGKWLAALVMYSCLLGFTALNFVFLFMFGHPDWKPLAAGYLGLLLQAGALLAIGTFISTTTKNQIIAGGVTFGVCLLLWVLSWVGNFRTNEPGLLGVDWIAVLAYLSTDSHVESFTKGVIETKDAVYYLTVIFLGLFLTARSMESLRWRA